MLVWTPSGWQWVPVVAGAWLVYELLRGLVVGFIKARYEAQVDRFLRRNEIPTDSFRHTHRVVVKEQVLADPGLAAAMDEQARLEGTGLGEQRARVREWLDEIVPQFNLLAYYKVGYAVGRMVAYSVYNVRLDQASLKAAQAKIPEGAAVVYVSNHRSNADFVVTGFMLSKSVQVSYAVGEWARVWPLEKLFKSFGSYFVRRGEKNPLYHRTLEAYVQLITKNSVTQAMFPEGGLTRDGKLRPVKLGLLDNMVRAKLDPAFSRPLVFVPVGINFDHVIEDENMVREARGETAKPQRSLGVKLYRLLALTGKGLVGIPLNTIRFLTKRLKKHGVAAIHFGDPVVFDDWYATQTPFLEEPDRHVRWEALRPFAEDLLDRVGGCIAATPVTMTCLAAQDVGEARLKVGADRGEMVAALREVQARLAAAGAPFATGDPYEKRQSWASDVAMQGHDLAELAVDVEESDELAAILDRALDVTDGRGLLFEQKGRLYIEDGAWPLVEYYANSLAQHLEDRRRPAADAAEMLAPEA